MPITTLAFVKVLADLYTRSETGAPDSADAGELGDIWLDNDPNSATYGATWELTNIVTVPAPAYTWTRITREDAKINIAISRAERDYLLIRGVPFDTDETTLATVYPEDAEYTAAEMVCYLSGYGTYQGRGNSSESVGDRSETYDKKIHGYPLSIVGGIERFQRAQ